MPKTNTHDDKKFILNDKNWPCWPFCPVKRLNNSLASKNLGFLYHDAVHSDGKVRIYHAYMFAPPKNLQETPTTEYDSVDAMLADGWVVD